MRFLKSFFRVQCEAVSNTAVCAQHLPFMFSQNIRCVLQLQLASVFVILLVQPHFANTAGHNLHQRTAGSVSKDLPMLVARAA